MGVYKHRGLTLIELLVVIAVIAIMTAILIPVMRRAREQGYMIRCLGNLKQWNALHTIYLQDNNGKFYSGSATGQQDDGFYWLTQMNARDQSCKNPIWVCPKCKGYYDDGGKRSIFTSWGTRKGKLWVDGQEWKWNPDGVGGSYGLNGWLLNVPDSGDELSEGRTRKDHWRTPCVNGASEIPLMVEALWLDLWPQSWQGPATDEDAPWDKREHMARACINRHNGMVNASFCDMSARKLGLKELWRLKWHRSFDTAGIWTTSNGNKPNWPAWMKSFKEY
jgi:prepilin-type N-terminal cleavage/methylation domain-containing protein/prepilin-type processing-associated H-X9-DG protein